MKRTLAAGAVVALALLTACTPNNSPGANPSADAPTEDVSSDASIILKLASGGSETLPMYLAIEEVFKPMVEEGSDGEIAVDLYPSSQLGDDVSLIEQLRSGTLEASIPSTAPLVGLVPELAVFDMPFLFNDHEAAYELLDGEFGTNMNERIEEAGLINLGWGELGFRHVTNSQRDVHTPDDLSGLRIRTQENPIQIETWRALGVNATPMPISEVFTAIQQGALDGQENPVSAFYGWSIHEVNEHVTLTGHVYSPSAFLISQTAWDTYDQETQDLLMAAGEATVERSREISQSQEGDLLAEMEEGGVTVTTLTDEEREQFQDATVDIWTDVEATAGAEIVAELRAELGHE